MPQIFVAHQSANDILDRQLIDEVANRIASTVASSLGSPAGAAGTTGATAQDDVIDDILSLDQGEAEDLVDLLADGAVSTTATAGWLAGTTEVSMAGAEDGFQDGEPNDPPGSEDEPNDAPGSEDEPNGIVRALKEQGFIKDSADFGESDPGRLEDIALQDRISTLADSEVTNAGFDSGIELWI